MYICIQPQVDNKVLYSNGAMCSFVWYTYFDLYNSDIIVTKLKGNTWHQAIIVYLDSLVWVTHQMAKEQKSFCVTARVKVDIKRRDLDAFS